MHCPACNSTRSTSSPRSAVSSEREPVDALDDMHSERARRPRTCCACATSRSWADGCAGDPCRDRGSVRLVDFGKAEGGPTTHLATGGGETTAFATLVHRVTDPVDASVSADSLVEGVDEDDFEVLVDAVLVDPVGLCEALQHIDLGQRRTEDHAHSALEGHRIVERLVLRPSIAASVGV